MTHQLQHYIWLAALGCFLTFAGCAESPTDPERTPPVGGGDTFVLDRELYDQIVAPIIAEKGCDAGGQCHGAGIRGTFQLSPQANKDQDFDFQQAALQANGYAPDQSALLTEPLDPESGGTVHPLASFSSQDDPDYAAILNWIEAGEFR